MKLKKLFKDIPVNTIKGSKDLEITGVCSNSKLVCPGNLFIARKGQSQDGAIYIPEAIQAGAVAVVTDIFDPLLSKNITQVIDPNIKRLEGLIAAQYYNFPSNELFMVAITGTNGKTTTSFLIKHILDTLEVHDSQDTTPSCGLIGTIEYIIGKNRYPATRTTPDVTANHKMLRDMVSQGSTCAVMEVTSHALDQNRVDAINFDTAVFTNLTLDHLDYHENMENYCKAKQKLFLELDPQKSKLVHTHPKTAVINIDSPWSEKMIKGCKAKIFTFGIDKKADLQAESIKLLPTGTEVILNYQGCLEKLNLPLVGRFNVYNCLAAIAVGLTRGFPFKKILKAISSVKSVPGRLEIVPNKLGLKIYVDFAHSDDALINVLNSLNEFKTGKIIVVFGCGGNRDASKRPLMAKAAQKHADEVIVTTDNPRNEDPLEIIRQITLGFEKPKKGLGNYTVEVDRAKAIAKAIEMATTDDIILLAGKGHEAYQIFAHQTIEFDDRQVAQNACEHLLKQDNP